MKIDEITKQSLLYDFYGQLLTQRQQQIFEMYTQENLSLAEISQELGISRQAVHDALRIGQKSLETYEEKLELIARFLRSMDAIEEIDGRILALIEKSEDRQTKRELEKIKAIIDGLEE